MRANLDALAANPGLPAAERDAIVRDAIAEQERATNLLAGLQALARGEAAETLPREDVELGDLVDGAIFAARRRHPQTTFTFADHAGGATLRGWPSGLRLVVDNLLDNAALHGGSQVAATLGPGGDGGLVLRVEDDGPGIPEAERDRLLEPFARGEGATRAGHRPRPGDRRPAGRAARRRARAGGRRARRARGRGAVRRARVGSTAMATQTAADLADVVLPDQDGTDVRLGDLWAERPVALVWLRHYG